MLASVAFEIYKPIICIAKNVKLRERQVTYRFILLLLDWQEIMQQKVPSKAQPRDSVLKNIKDCNKQDTLVKTM